MTITSRVQSEFFEKEQHQERLIRIAPHQGRVGRSSSPSSNQSAAPGGSNSSWGLSWTDDEHNRFLEAMELFPSGPWKVIANYVGTKTPRQTMTHAQKYRQKIARRKRGLKTTVKQPDEELSQPRAPSPPQQLQQLPPFPATPHNAMLSNDVNTTTLHQYVPILPWSALTTPQMVMQEHHDFVLDAPANVTLFESDDDFAQFLLEDYEPLLFSDDLDTSLEDEMEISRILAECGW